VKALFIQLFRFFSGMPQNLSVRATAILIPSPQSHSTLPQ
jgi:hypothetical protein